MTAGERLIAWQRCISTCISKSETVQSRLFRSRKFSDVSGSLCLTACLTLPLFYASFFTQTLILLTKNELERVKGIEPSSQAWEARILPLDHTRAGTVSNFPFLVSSRLILRHK